MEGRFFKECGFEKKTNKTLCQVWILSQYGVLSEVRVQWLQLLFPPAERPTSKNPYTL